MANPPGSLTLAELDTRFVNSIRDSGMTSADRYRYLNDAYSRLWYLEPWEFRRAEASISISAGVSEYQLDDQCDLLAAVFNSKLEKPLVMNKGFYQYWADYADESHSGTPENVADIRSVNGNVLLVLQEIPTTGQGHGDELKYYYTKHLIHNISAGTTVSGGFSVSTDVPSFAPQFHVLIVKEALLEALKDKRQFSEVYQAVARERDELLKSMRKRYLTPARFNNQVRVQR